MNSLYFLLVLYLCKCAECAECSDEYNCKSPQLEDGGSVIAHYDESYNIVRLDQFASIKSSISERNEILSPTLIVVPNTETEIKNTLIFANRCGYTISVRSGGHQYSGLSSCNGLNGKCIQIDMKHFDYMYYNKDNNDEIDTIIVGVGMKLLDVFTENDKNDVAILGGSCGNVGVGGHYQSSSQSTWSRSLGLGMDWIVGIKIITPNGKIQKLYKNTDNEEEKDLFWAILGGSPGSWGVVIEYEFKPIINSNYPHSSSYSFAHFYTKTGFQAFFTEFINLLNNPYFTSYNDVTVTFIGGPLSFDIGTGMVMSLLWSGIDNGDIDNIIPNHPTAGRTWYEELVQPFINIDRQLNATKHDEFSFEGAISISGLLLKRASNGYISVSPYRYFNTHSTYTQQQFDGLLNDTIKTREWIESITNKIDEIAANSSDNVEILYQFWDLFRREGKIADDIIITHDPLINSVSWPLRNMRLESDNWILFGDGDTYSDDIIFKAKQYRDELEDILTQNQIKSDYKSFGYTDLNGNEYDLNTQFNEFYVDRQDVYKKLQDVKMRVDPNNLFKGPLTIPFANN